jgi:L-histidine N-alpha-methyltransferase
MPPLSVGRGEAASSVSGDFGTDLVAGLTVRPKRVAPIYFYDAVGSRLFEEITQLPEYYPTRTELRILKTHAGAIAGLLPPRGVLVEFGSGSTAKVRLLLDHLRDLSAYVPVDISGEYLSEEAQRLRTDYPGVAVLPVIADFTKPFDLPCEVEGMKRAGFFPGSTIGNFEPAAARAFLRHAAAMLGPGAPFIVGVDLVKDREVLERAYDDEAGVTAAFNLNLLARANRELGADFDLDAFAHRAFFDPQKSRIEMHLVSRKAQVAHVAGVSISFAEGETIHTENSYKYTLNGFRALASEAGWDGIDVWTDSAQLFAVHALRRRP